MGALEATRCKERQSSNMKYLVLLALFSVAFADAEPEPTAAADPNADPWLYYGGYYGGLGHGYYGGLGHYGYGLGHYGYGYGLGGRYLWGRKKRSAEAEPAAEAEADPWLYYGLSHYGGYYGRGYYGGYYGLGHRGYIWG